MGEWWQETQQRLADVVVVDLPSGNEVFRSTAPAQSGVTDFDGRFLVIEQSGWGNDAVALIHDTRAVMAPAAVPGSVTLLRS